MSSLLHRRTGLATLVLLLLAAGPVAGDCLVIAHRGASGYLPEHTLPAYRLAGLLGADYLEPDLVLTRDNVLVARHEAALAGTTDVADRPEFRSRRRTRTVDGRAVDDWFSDDFTLAELRTLRARERLPDWRPANAAFDGQFAIPTFDEVLVSRETLARQLGRPIGVYPELKSPALFRGGGRDPEQALAAALAARGLDRREAPVIVQSFDADSLQRLAPLTKVRRVQLLPLEGPDGAPLPLPAPADVARYADGLGVARHLVLDADGKPTGLVTAAKSLGLFVHAWTFRRETATGEPPGNGPLPTRAAAIADIRRYLAAGIDGFFTDQPDLGAAACSRDP
jgi:glycerophosphoryl diester phosphodiesterase